MHWSHFERSRNGGSARESNPPRTPLNAPLLVLKTRPVTRLDPLPQRILRIFLKWSIEVLEDVVTGRPVPARSASASRVSAGHLAALHYPCWRSPSMVRVRQPFGSPKLLSMQLCPCSFVRSRALPPYSPLITKPYRFRILLVPQ